MRDDDRDRVVDRFLHDALMAQTATSAPEACVDGETLAAWMSRSLRAEQARDVEQHLSDCARCQALLAMLIRSAPAEPEVHPFWWRGRLQWFVPLATAATAAAIWLAIPVASPTRSAPDQAQQPERAEPAAADSDRSANQEPPARLSQQEPPAQAVETLSGKLAPTEVGDRVAEERQEIFRSRESSLESSTRSLGRQARADADADKEAAAVAQPLSETVLLTTEIEIPGPGARWRIRAGRLVERSTSGGTAWDAVAIPAGPDALTAGSAVSPTVCWIVGRGGAVYVTTDGVQFVRVSFPETADLVAVRGTDEHSATVTATDGRSWRTADQGRTWNAASR
jgi:hypothetical protein